MSEEIRLEEELNASFVSPERFFKDEKLAAYTEGSRLLCLQVRDPSDSSLWFVWSFLYLHILLAKDRKAAIRLAWDKDLFREKLLDWISDKTEDDRINASNLVGAILDEAGKAKVEIVPSSIPQAPPGND